MKKKIIIVSSIFSIFLLLLVGSYSLKVNSIPKLFIPNPGQEMPEINYEFIADKNGLPAEAAVYKFILPDNPEEQAAKLSKIFGFVTSPKFDASTQKYISKIENEKDKKWFTYEATSGHWAYQDMNALSDINPSNIPADKDAIAIVKKYLEETGLLPDRFKDVKVVHQSSGDKTTGDYRVIYKDLYFYPTIDNTSILGVSRMIVSVGKDAQIIAVNKYYKDYQQYKTVKLKSVDTAYEDVKANRASNSIDPTAKSAKIKEVKLAYWEDAGSIKEQPYLQPVWVFTGEAIVEYNKVVTFDAIVPAIE